MKKIPCLCLRSGKKTRPRQPQEGGSQPDGPVASTILSILLAPVILFSATRYLTHAADITRKERLGEALHSSGAAAQPRTQRAAPGVGEGWGWNCPTCQNKHAWLGLPVRQAP